MRNLGTLLLMVFLATVCHAANEPKRQRTGDMSPLDRYVEEAMGRSGLAVGASGGSTYSGSLVITDLATDIRARRVDDIVTVLVLERASAVSQGTLQSSRQSSVSASVGALAGVTRAAGPLANLAETGLDRKLEGQASTARATTLTTTLTARVTHVLPNGNLVIEGAKQVQVNSERQVVTLRGVVRPADLTTDNLVRSDQVAQMEINISGKGAVGDAIRRPFILYRLLLGLLPF